MNRTKNRFHSKFRCAVMAIVLMSGQALAGPFGLEMGMSKADLGITSSTPQVGDPTEMKWSLTKVPQGSPLMESYVVKVTPKHGLCYVKAVGFNISDSRYGNKLTSTYNRVDKALSKSYGKGNKTHFLRSGSIWDEPEDFMMALVKQERVMATYYDEEEGSTMKDKVQAAYLNGKALNAETGYVTVDYRFDNHSACVEEIEEAIGDVF